MRRLLAAASALAAGMGVGGFVFTPLLPLMHVSPRLGAALATANYVGYLVGAALGIAVPALTRSRPALRTSLVTLIATLALMPLFPYAGCWLILRLVAGVASAIIFVVAAQAVLADFRADLAGWAFGGIGLGIALSGALVLLLRASGSWQSAWFSAAALAAVFAALAWPLSFAATTTTATTGRGSRWFVALVVCYTLEGVGYIIAGTFLVAAIDERAPGGLGAGAWILVGVAALPSAAVLTTAYAAGQIAGPLLVTPLLHNGYALALLTGSVIVAGGAGAAAVLRHRFPEVAY